MPVLQEVILLFFVNVPVAETDDIHLVVALVARYVAMHVTLFNFVHPENIQYKDWYPHAVAAMFALVILVQFLNIYEYASCETFDAGNTDGVEVSAVHPSNMYL